MRLLHVLVLSGLLILCSRTAAIELSEGNAAAWGTFASDGATSAENMGATIGGAGAVCEDDLRCVYAPNSGAAGGPNLTGLNGKSATGTWRFCVGDGGDVDAGMINRVTLTITR
jgi:hypothetical protein